MAAEPSAPDGLAQRLLRRLTLVLGLAVGVAALVDFLGDRRLLAEAWMLWVVESAVVFLIVGFLVSRRSRRSAAAFSLVSTSLLSVISIALAVLIFRTENPLLLKISASVFYICFSILSFLKFTYAWSEIWPSKDRVRKTSVNR